MPNTSRRREFLLARRAAGIAAKRALPGMAQAATVAPEHPKAAARSAVQRGDPRRRANPANFLLPGGIHWFTSLPNGLRPVALAERYPRIVNQLAQSWRSPSACRAKFEDLLSDRRGNRRGFSQDIRHELVRLQGHYLTTFLTFDD